MTPQQRRQNSPFRPNVPPRQVGPEYYDRALELVNYFRMQGNAPFMDMGYNPAAQQHADDCLSIGLASQWDLDGLKPYMRYSWAGGYQATKAFFWNYVEPAGITDLELMIEDGVTWLFETMGNRRVALDSLYRRVNLGIAWNQWQFVLVVEFEGDYVDFVGFPTIDNGVLAFSGKVKNGVRLRSDADFSADIWYEPWPQPPSVGQLLRVNAYDHGTIIANLRPPPPAGQYWTENRGDLTIEKLAAPEDFPPNSPVPSNPVEINALRHEAYLRNEQPRRVQVTYPFLDCQRWTVTSEGFAVAADIGSVWREYGGGVYSLMVWATLEGRDGRVNIAKYAMFVR